MKKRPSQDDSGTSRKKKSVPRAELPTERRGSSGSDDIAEGISSEDYQPLIIGDRAAVTTFYMTRLRQMQQLMCKVVAKAWIKVVEPKKQSNFPYNRGEESKPAWWPRDVRHKEPDHLMKPERLTLLLTMLRSRKVPIDKLEAATSEVMVQIPKERIPLLNEIYQVARQEERFERSELPPSTIVYVAASEKIIRSPPAKEQSPQMRRPSIASPIGTSSAGSMQDRRMSVQSDMVNLSDGRDMDMRVPSRMGSRDDSASMHSQPGHNPYAGSGASGGVDSALGYTANYVAQSSITTASPLPEQPFIEMRSADYFMMVRRNPSALPPPTANSVHTSWPAPPMMYPFSPGSSSGHSSFNMPRQSASNPQTPVGGGQFQGHQQAQLGNRPSNMGGEGGGDQYDASNPMGPATHTNSLGFTEFLHRDLPGEDGNGRTKME
ncbi:hypothetical protein FN846DRAFT_781031 [Sphaerosporella brunnea]|uniref:Subtelomeric hrmA-associated cluster protein AFUB-079030/YDR124W-like helical bundle domain-containing protein n=1 Tax=Sphaerosporella brunnea TaxID=1250544 RepID=A0A5J5ESH7_9PEZI|nr:hypothetical protein FN846DRAFT_781031 [Sphaerosporella brunnea]